jgi:hypothetical protein
MWMMNWARRLRSQAPRLDRDCRSSGLGPSSSWRPPEALPRLTSPVIPRLCGAKTQQSHSHSSSPDDPDYRSRRVRNSESRSAAHIISISSIALCARVSRGTWVVIRPQREPGTDKPKMSTHCPAPNYGKEFKFDWSETRVYEVPLELFERRHFYRSELQESET